MNFGEAAKLATISLRTNKMRSFLTLLGVIIGITAIISILTLGDSLQTQLERDLESTGANDYLVQLERREKDPSEGESQAYSGAIPQDVSDMFTPAMVDEIRAQLSPDVTAIGIGVNEVRYSGTLTKPEDILEKSGDASMIPANQDAMTMANLSIIAGRGLEDTDLDGARQVAIIPQVTVDKLFGGNTNSALGQVVSFENSAYTADFTIVGVYSKPKAGVLMGNGPDTMDVYFPYTSVSNLDANSTLAEGFASFNVRIDKNKKQETVPRLRSLLDSLMANNLDYKPVVKDFSEELQSLNQVLFSIRVGLAAIGGISLLVGGIGVMNIMLITVTERTREIGIRMALGARRKDIRTQFVIEAVIICLIGGAIGVVLGAALGMAGATALGTFVFPPISSILISVLFSLAIGLFFGYYPANKASKLNPIEALRYE